LKKNNLKSEQGREGPTLGKLTPKEEKTIEHERRGET